MLSKEDVIEINKLFDKGKIINMGSLEFAISSSNKTKEWITQLAYLLRAILLDHVFEEGNKRTAAAIIGTLMEMHSLAPDNEKIAKGITKILKGNISSIKEIEKVIKDGIRV